MQNEYRSELAVAALHASIRHQALVWRDGRQQRLDVADLVPGDVVALRVGDVVPADLRLLEANQLECDEAVLTGEPVPAVKTTAPAPTGDSTLDLPACAFMGTVVHQGAGRGVVVATGAQTAFGKIAVGLSQRQAETAFQAGLRGFSKLLVAVAQGAIGFDQALDPAGQPAGWPLLLGLVCNEATVGEHGPVGGNALDVALWSAPAAQPLTADPAGGPSAYQRQGLVPFDHDRQLASVAVRTPAATTLLVTKGAPEAVLARWLDIPADAQAALARLFADGARVIAVATRDAPGLTIPGPADEHDLHLAGFLTFTDRPKADAGAAIAKLHGLGVTVKVITGDNPVVAAKVCRDLSLHVEGVRRGAELERLDDDALAATIAHTTVFARISPDQKAGIIKVARHSSADVAFLGDGVNDAVALHAADVGISVEGATDVAKDAADIVLLDKDLGVLADGVMEGRRIFANTLKYVLMATSSNGLARKQDLPDQLQLGIPAFGFAGVVEARRPDEIRDRLRAVGSAWPPRSRTGRSR
jgi:magnesium-transporting ATPase (P-type)